MLEDGGQRWNNELLRPINLKLYSFIKNNVDVCLNTDLAVRHGTKIRLISSPHGRKERRCHGPRCTKHPGVPDRLPWGERRWSNANVRPYKQIFKRSSSSSR